VGEELGISFWVAESSAKLCVAILYEVFRILVGVGGKGGGCAGPFLLLPGKGGACRELGRRCGARHLGEQGCLGSHTM